MVVQKALFGVYAGSVVAPNYKGMPLLAPVPESYPEIPGFLSRVSAPLRRGSG